MIAQPSAKQHAGTDCWRQNKLRLKTSPKIVIARFVNLGDLDEISQLQHLLMIYNYIQGWSQDFSKGG